MNIFPIAKDITDPHGVDWLKSAKLQDDLRVIKMSTESCQLLGSVALLYGMRESMPHQKAGKTHMKHPSTLWTAASSANYKALLYHTDYLIEECYTRFNRPPGYYKKWDASMKSYRGWFLANYSLFPSEHATKLPLCMGTAPQYINENDLVGSYQRYYANKPLLRYVRADVPEFVTRLREPGQPKVLTN